MNVFQSRLISLCDSAGKNQREIADEIGITPTSLCRYITTGRLPEASALMKIAKHFKVTIDWLLGISDSRISAYPDEAVTMCDLYMRASESDKKVIKTILEKYI